MTQRVAQRLAHVHAACFSTAHPWTEAGFAALLEDPACALIERPGGFGLLRCVADEAEILTLAVLREHRRRGIGRALLQAMEAEARHRQARRMFLEVSRDNRAARALYAAAGYRQTGLRRAYFRQPDGSTRDALILSRALA